MDAFHFWNGVHIQSRDESESPTHLGIFSAVIVAKIDDAEDRSIQL